MKNGRLVAVAVLAAACVLAASAFLALRAQEDPHAPPEEPALGVLSSGGHRASTLAFLKALNAPATGVKNAPKGGVTLFVPGPEQLYNYGGKAGVIAFAKNLPQGRATIQVLVRDAYRLEALGDKAQALEFLKALGSRDAAVELLVADFQGLARLGARASMMTFVRSLPPGSSLHLFTSPRELTRYGDDAGALTFIDAFPGPVEVHLDDPMLEVLVRRWEAARKPEETEKKAD